MKLKLKSKKLINSLQKSKLRKKRSKYKIVKQRLKQINALLSRKTWSTRKLLLKKNLRLQVHWLNKPSKP